MPRAGGPGVAKARPVGARRERRHARAPRTRCVTAPRVLRAPRGADHRRFGATASQRTASWRRRCGTEQRPLLLPSAPAPLAAVPACEACLRPLICAAALPAQLRSSRRLRCLAPARRRAPPSRRRDGRWQRSTPGGQLGHGFERQRHAGAPRPGRRLRAIELAPSTGQVARQTLLPLMAPQRVWPSTCVPAAGRDELRRAFAAQAP